MGIAFGALGGLFGALIYFGASKQRRISDVLLTLFIALVTVISDFLVNSLDMRTFASIRWGAVTAAAVAFAVATTIGLVISGFVRARDGASEESRVP